MNPKKVALVTCAILALILLLDFNSRISAQQDVSEDKAADTSKEQIHQASSTTLMTLEQVETLLAWSDIKPDPAVVVNPEPQSKPVEQAVEQTPPPEPQVDLHTQVRQAIEGNVSKSLLGDNLFTLRGIFNDQQDFAVIEVENIISKQKEYFRTQLNGVIGGYTLVAIGKNYVSIKNGDQNVRLQMFEGAL